jgi:hypothetical protein
MAAARRPGRMPPPAGTERSRVSRRRQVAWSEVRRVGLATACAMSAIDPSAGDLVAEELRAAGPAGADGAFGDHPTVTGGDVAINVSRYDLGGPHSVRTETGDHASYGELATGLLAGQPRHTSLHGHGRISYGSGGCLPQTGARTGPRPREGRGYRELARDQATRSTPERSVDAGRPVRRCLPLQHLTAVRSCVCGAPCRPAARRLPTK